MIFRRALTGIPFMFLTLLCFPQTDSLNSRAYISSNISLAFNGSLIYPGIRTGIELPVSTADLIISRRSKDPKRITRDRFIAVNAGWYHHPYFHDNFYLTGEWRMRRTLKGGFFSEFSPGIGYSRTFLGGTTYEVNDNGDVRIKKLAGYNYAMATVGGGLGFSLSEKKGIPLSLYSRLNILLMFPYNSTIYFRPAIEIGLIYKPACFIPLNVRKRIIKK
jgi:hypothetical protein